MHRNRVNAKQFRPRGYMTQQHISPTADPGGLPKGRRRRGPLTVCPGTVSPNCTEGQKVNERIRAREDIGGSETRGKK